MDKASMWEGRETDIVKEAQMIIDRYALSLQRKTVRKNKKKDSRLLMFSIIMSSAAIFLLLFLKFY